MLLFLIMLDSDEDRSKFVQLYHKYRYFLWYLACERLQDDHLAEDAVQETFLALTHHIDKVGCVESAATRNFLATISKKIKQRIYGESVRESWKRKRLPQNRKQRFSVKMCWISIW